MTIVVTTGISDPRGGLGAFTVADTNAAAADSLQLDLTFTGNGVKSCCFVVKENVAPATRQDIKIVNTISGLDMYDGQITSWSSGEPQITDGAGTTLDIQQLIDDWWAVFGQTLSVTAANLHQAQIHPAPAAAGETGSINIYRVNAFNSVAPGSIVDALVSRLAETVQYPFNALPMPHTGLVEFVERGTVLGSSLRVVEIGGPAASGAYLSVQSDGSGAYLVKYNDGTTTRTTTAFAASPTVGQRTEILWQLDEFGALTAQQSIVSGTPNTQGPEAALALPPAWQSQNLTINAAQDLASVGVGEFNSVKIAPGVRTLDYMREAY